MKAKGKEYYGNNGDGYENRRKEQYKNKKAQIKNKLQEVSE